VADDPNAGSRPTGDRPSGSARPSNAPDDDDWIVEDLVADADGRSIEALDPPAARAIPDPSSWLPALKGRSTSPGVCPFLRAVGPDGGLGLPVESPDVTNRCAALRDAVPQSLRQQELVCLTASHINCPRYLRGALVAAEAPVGRVRMRSALTPAITAALVVLVLSFVASVAFVVANGGLALPVAAVDASPSPSGSTAALGPSAEPTARVTPRASIAPSAAPASPSVAPTPTTAAVADPTPKPTKTAKPKPSSNRYALLTACPNKPNCWIYVIRSGDNLFSIANYFGVPLERVKALNPWTRTERLRAGRQLILPTPTR
jgi:LysM repeat protein